jgi:hypothetical protein
MTPERTKQYRTTKTGAVRVYEGSYTMPPHVRVALACREGVEIIAEHAGQEAFAVSPKTHAYATAPDTRAYACCSWSRATAEGKGAQAFAMHSQSKAYSARTGSVAYATVEGARVYKRDYSATIIVDTVQSVFPNFKRELPMTFT